MKCQLKVLIQIMTFCQTLMSFSRGTMHRLEMGFALVVVGFGQSKHNRPTVCHFVVELNPKIHLKNTKKTSK